MFVICSIVRAILVVTPAMSLIFSFAIEHNINKQYFYNISSIIIQVIIGILTYFGMLITLKDDYVFKFFNKIKQIVFRKKENYNNQL